MSIARLKIPCAENDTWLFRFRSGDEAALNYLYRVTHAALEYRARLLVRDNFVANTLVQDALLKCWTYRERMESLYHIYRFMRMNITWGGLGYHRSVAARFQRCMVFTEFIEYYKDPSEEIREAQAVDNGRMQLIEAVIPYLSLHRQTMMELYFRQGLSYKKIAGRMGSNTHHVRLEIQKSLELIRKALHGHKPCVPASTKVSLAATNPAAESMDPETWQVFKWRYELKMSFEIIARKLNRPKEIVQQHYIAAHRQMQALSITPKKPGFFSGSNFCHQN